MPIGPTLPPTAEKRKRERDDEDVSRSSGSDSEDSLGPHPPQNVVEPSVKKARVSGPSLPPSSAKSNLDQAAEDETRDGSSSSDDDDFGPAPPTAAEASTQQQKQQTDTITSKSPNTANAPSAPAQRDEWMTLAPTGGDWSQRVDPTKLKNRKFNTGKTSSSSTRGASDAWNETPAEKQARLQREVLGIKDSKKAGHVDKPVTPSEQDGETVRRMKEYNAQRGPSLYEAHQKGHKVEKDDDPSARNFDREKDIGGGLQINSTQRKEMMKKSSDFNSRFSSAKYL